MQLTKRLLLDYLFGGQERVLKDRAPDVLHWELKRRSLNYTRAEVIEVLKSFLAEGLISNDEKFTYDRRTFKD